MQPVALYRRIRPSLSKLRDRTRLVAGFLQQLTCGSIAGLRRRSTKLR
jgi:hypothetical protein